MTATNMCSNFGGKWCSPPASQRRVIPNGKSRDESLVLFSCLQKCPQIFHPGRPMAATLAGTLTLPSPTVWPRCSSDLAPNTKPLVLLPSRLSVPLSNGIDFPPNFPNISKYHLYSCLKRHPAGRALHACSAGMLLADKKLVLAQLSTMARLWGSGKTLC